MTTLYLGEIKGHAFVAAHALSEHEQQHAAELISRFAAADDHDPIKFAAGWTIHNAEPDIYPEIATEVRVAHDVAAEYVGKVPEEAVARFVGREALQPILNHHESHVLSSMPAPVAEQPVSIYSIAR